MNKVIKISIRNLVEFIMRHGDIDNRFVSNIKAIEGIKGHQKVQQSYKENYETEVPIKHEFTYEEIQIIVEGRIDGVLKESNKIIIDEIKTTTKELLLIDENTNPLHWAQAKCYGYIYCLQHDLKNIDVQITYYNIETKETRILRKNYNIEELKEFFYYLINEYKDWAKIESEWIKKRNHSMKKLKFPFGEYRKGQRDLAVRVYKSIVESKKCFGGAPTGTGKTVSTLFPAIKAMGENHTSKIFYLTAKTITREVAEDTINLMRNQSLDIKSVTITAKEKICKMKEVNCNPDYCIYAKGYYDKINNALKEILIKYDDYSRKSIDKISEEYKLCPFELSLDLTTLSDVIICDYNYVFDPKVYLKRFFDIKKTDFTFLIDESHNLVDRSREMYSANISEEKFTNIKKNIGKKDKKINYTIKEIEKYFKEKSKKFNNITEDCIIEKEAPSELCSILRSFIKVVDDYLGRTNKENEELMDIYFEVRTFIGIYDFYNDNYCTIYSQGFSGVKVKLYCVNPSQVIIDRINKSKSTTLFSATLIPMNYFKRMYGANEEDFTISLTSPFSTSNRLLMIGNNVQTTYNKRNKTSNDICDYIHSMIKAKIGNYMVFFPSYKYMALVYNKMRELYPNVNISIQENNMSENDKEEFLKMFDSENDETHVGFCVLGGHFSEGIDLTNDKLIGVAIIGVGMPQIGVEREIIRDYMNEDNKGFDYAYVYPGMIKVLQAAGRCIRTKNDRGVILLLDERYSSYRYKSLFPSNWNEENVNVKSSEDVEIMCKRFWNM